MPIGLREVRTEQYEKCTSFSGRGYTEVVDPDLSSYFDTIPHHELMQRVARRVSDGAMLALIKSWLEMAVEAEDGKGNKQRRTVNKDSGRGTPQGAPLAAVGQSVHATLPSWMEDIGLEREVASSHRQLCRRLCDPVPRGR